MVSADDVGRVPLFGSLSPDEHERLARVAADVHLEEGEYAAHEGDGRALYAVLEGRIEAVKLTDGVEQVVGQRQPGEIFGEVPITLGTGFPVGFRAGEATRVMRVEARDYHALASTAPDLVSAVGKLAAERISGPRGLQGIAAGSLLPAPSSSATRTTVRAPSCAASSTGTRIRSRGYHWRRRLRPRRIATASTRSSASPTGRPSFARAARGRRPAGAPDLRRSGRVRHADRRGRPGGPRGCGLRRLGGPAHDRDRA